MNNQTEQKNTIVAWDIGIKNLSYCILSKTNKGCPTSYGYNIIDWEVINLYNDAEKKHICSSSNKNNKKCNHKGIYIEQNVEEKVFYCKKHKTPTSIIYKPKKVKNRNPFEYATRIKQELDKRPTLQDVDIVLVENQPALMNPIMKSIQMMIFSYFSFLHSAEKKIEVYNVNAKRKEKLPDKDDSWITSSYYREYQERIEKTKNKYTKRKLLCFYYALLCVETSPEMKEYLMSHKKKDDLTDSLLMCLEWFSR